MRIVENKSKKTGTNKQRKVLDKPVPMAVLGSHMIPANKVAAGIAQMLTRQNVDYVLNEIRKNMRLKP